MVVEQPKKPHVYEESTQYKHWRFSSKQLWNMRNENNKEAITRVRRIVQEEQDANKESKTDDKEYLSPKEELALCRFYEKQLQFMSRHCKFPNVVMATAIAYMKRFFLNNTVMDYHPKDIRLTCLFLATKAEGERISIKEFGEKLRLPNVNSVLDLEFTVSQGLKFEYYVHHPYRPAYGFFLDLQQSESVDLNTLKDTYSKVEKILADIILSDLPLIYQPSQLALAAFISAGEENGFDQRVKDYITDKFGNNAATLLNIINKIVHQIKEFKPVTQDEAKKIDYKLKRCKNPAMNPESTM
ncbi:cyclin-like protein [Mycotypha africana]|uniref:cyclin-like protein n=1 Tax=Mycotypha africana TaxID=64632 RepID=UPI002300CB0F|nr:cyclin-like protein [Mycotypha africana]KAI8984477.1 cyclin-like protein [Mycotypha africana]